MKYLLSLMLITILTGCARMPLREAQVSLEFRPGSHTPEPGMKEMTVVGTGAIVYISNEVVLSNADVKSARVITDHSQPQIEIQFTEAGAARFAEATEKYHRKPIGILVDGRLISAPVVQERITGSRAIIAGLFSEEEAQRIAEGIVVR